MPTPVTVQFANPDPSDSPTTFTEAVALLNALVTSSLEADFQSFVVGAATPAVDDQDKVWFKMDGSGRPLGAFQYYGGFWRRSGNGRTGQVAIFSGDPSISFEANGRGKVGMDWDGWALLDGQGGRANLSDKFIVAAHMDNSGGTDGYSAGWRTTVGGSASSTGGDTGATIANENLPRMDINVTGNLYEPDDNNLSPRKIIIEDDYVVGSGSVSTVDVADFGQDEPEPISTLPPYYALAYVQFIGYA